MCEPIADVCVCLLAAIFRQTWHIDSKVLGFPLVMLQSFQLQGLRSLTPCRWTPLGAPTLDLVIGSRSALDMSRSPCRSLKKFLWAPMNVGGGEHPVCHSKFTR